MQATFFGITANVNIRHETEGSFNDNHHFFPPGLDLLQGLWTRSGSTTWGPLGVLKWIDVATRIFQKHDRVTGGDSGSLTLSVVSRALCDVLEGHFGANIGIAGHSDQHRAYLPFSAPRNGTIDILHTLGSQRYNIVQMLSDNASGGQWGIDSLLSTSSISMLRDTMHFRYTALSPLERADMEVNGIEALTQCQPWVVMCVTVNAARKPLDWDDSFVFLQLKMSGCIDFITAIKSLMPAPQSKSAPVAGQHAMALEGVTKLVRELEKIVMDLTGCVSDEKDIESNFAIVGYINHSLMRVLTRRDEVCSALVQVVGRRLLGGYNVVGDGPGRHRYLYGLSLHQNLLICIVAIAKEDHSGVLVEHLEALKLAVDDLQHHYNYDSPRSEGER